MPRVFTATIDTRLRALIRSLKDAGIQNEQLIARRVLCEATRLSAAQLIARANDPLATCSAQRCDELQARLLSHEPLSRILGHREFYGRAFFLNEATLDPRPDTETIIDAVIELSSNAGWRTRPFRFLDIGTGTGCLAVTLLAEFPDARAVATDISSRALEAARHNASLHNVEDRLEFLNRLSLDRIDGPFDLLVSNPPYIRTSEIQTLSPQVKRYDPLIALDGGPDGLKVYRQIARDLRRVVPNGWAAFEVGADQSQDVADILRPVSQAEPRIWQDLSGHTRCVAVQTHCA